MGETVDTMAIDRGLVSLVIAVSGHRELKKGTEEAIKEKIKAVLKQLADCYKHTPVLVITGMAAGADQLAVSVVKDLQQNGYSRQIKYRPVLAMPEEAFLARDFDEVAKVTFHEQMGDVKGHTILPIDAPHTVNQLQNNEMNARTQQFSRLAELLAKSSQLVIAVWDGKPGGAGGTSEVVNRKLGRFKIEESELPLLHSYHRQRLESSSVGLNPLGLGPVYHIRAQRKDEEEASPEQVASWLYPELIADEDKEDDSAAKTPYVNIYLLLDEYNRDVLNGAKKLQTAASEKYEDMVGKAKVAHLTAGMEWVAGIRSWAAALAEYYSKQNSRFLMAALCFLFMAGIGVHLISPWPAADVVFIALYYIGICGFFVVRRFEEGFIEFFARRLKHNSGNDKTLRQETPADKTQIDASTAKPGRDAAVADSNAPLGDEIQVLAMKLRRKHEDYRALSEALRVQYYWLAAGIQEIVAEAYLDKHIGDMAWVRDATSDTLLYVLNGKDNQHDENLLSRDLTQDWISAQLNFYVSRSKKKESRNDAYRWLRRVFFAFGAVGPVVYLLIERYFYCMPNLDPVLKLTEIFSALMILFAVLISNYTELQGFEEESQQYRQAAAIFKRAKKRLKELTTELDEIETAQTVERERRLAKIDEIRDLLRVVGRVALAEHGDWLAMHRGRDLNDRHGAL
jgi:hypothetical protein